MALTHSILNVGGTLTDMKIELLDQALLSQVGESTLDSGRGVRQTVYTFTSGDERYPTNVTVRWEKSPKSSDPTRFCHIEFATWALTSDSVTGIDVYKRLTAKLSLILPNMVVESADLAKLCANLFGLTFTSLTAEVRDVANLDDLRHGITKLF